MQDEVQYRLNIENFFIHKNVECLMKAKEIHSEISTDIIKYSHSFQFHKMLCGQHHPFSIIDLSDHQRFPANIKYK